MSAGALSNGSSELERWIGQHLLKVVGNYINPPSTSPTSTTRPPSPSSSPREIGKLIATVSDRIVVYTVTGTLDSPKIGVKPPDIKSGVEAFDPLDVFKK